MPNTKEPITIESALRKFVHSCYVGCTKSELETLRQEAELALSNPLEQSELQQKYNKLKEAFKYACKEYIHEDVIEECMNRAGLEQSENKEGWVSVETVILVAMGFNQSVYNNTTYFFHKDIVEINLKVYGNTYWVRFRDQDIKPIKNIGDLKSTVFAMTGKTL